MTKKYPCFHLYYGIIQTINTPPILVSSSTKCIATQILIIAELSGRKDLVLRGCVYDMIFPANSYLFERWVSDSCNIQDGALCDNS